MSEISERQSATSPNGQYNLNGRPRPAGPVSYEEFLEWADEDTHAEWVNGEIEMSSPASYRHQDIKGFLESTLRLYCRALNLGIVLSAGFQMKLPGGGPGREPDLLFVRQENLSRLRPTFIDGPADLAVEIVSPESANRDRQTKLAEYAAGHVSEYWLIDPLNQQAHFYQLGTNSQYERIEPTNGRYQSREVAGFWLEVAWLNQEPLPEVETVLLQVGGEAYLRYILERARQAGLNP